jgi:hypothetical protein
MQSIGWSGLFTGEAIRRGFYEGIYRLSIGLDAGLQRFGARHRK